MKESYLNIIKIGNTYSHHHIQWVKTKGVSLKNRNKPGISAFTALIQRSPGSSSHSHRTKRRNKRHPNWKGKNKFSLFTDDMIPYIEQPKESTRKLLNLINEFSKVAGYEINIQKSVTFLYTYNELSEKEIKKTIPFTIATTTKIRYLGINLTKEVEDLYSETT